ncbi:ABC transporter permease [Ligilactobacillus pabuli]
MLYVAFLKDNIMGDNFPGHTQFLDCWLISGTLAITGITTTLSVLSQKTEDYETKTSQDFTLTGISSFKLNGGYLLSAAFVGFVMQMIVFAVMYLYFHLVDDLQLTDFNFGALVGIMLLGAGVNAVVNAVLILFVRNRSTLSAISTIVGTVSGFLVGAYIPIGVLPEAAQWVVKFTPGAYVAALFRQLFLKNDLEKLFPANVRQELAEQLGIQLKWGRLLDYGQTLLVTIGLFGLFLVILVTIEAGLNAQRQRAKA